MTPTMQRGYDDQMGGGINADLFCGDTDEAREYRAGAREARREKQFGPAPAIERGPELVAPNRFAAEDERRRLEWEKSVRDEAWRLNNPQPSPAPIAAGPNAFSDPVPNQKPKKSKPKPDDAQLGLF